jgi:HEAT repeat protein
MTGAIDRALADSSEPAALVESFATSTTRVQALSRLQALGAAALPAVRAGLKHPDWHVRHWCAIYLDHDGDRDSLGDLIPLLSDPATKVRLWAVHSISCEGCKAQGCGMDVVPLLIERLEKDTSSRVRKMAVAMLASLPPDARVVPALKAALNNETDGKIRLHADLGLRKYRDAGMT